MSGTTGNPDANVASGPDGTPGGALTPTQALADLGFTGSPQVVAAFKIGWQVARIRWAVETGSGLDTDWVARKIMRIESAFKDLTAFVVTTAVLPAAPAGASYSAQLCAGGGVSPYAWKIASGKLPPTLTMTDGEITGTPSDADAGSYVFVVEATDKAGAVSYQALTLTVPGKGLLIRAISLPRPVVGQEYTGILSAEGGSGNYQWTLDPEAVGDFTVDEATGKLTGTPGKPGQVDLVVTVRDGGPPQDGSTALTGQARLPLTVLDRYSFLFDPESCPSTAGLRLSTAEEPSLATDAVAGAAKRFDRDMRRMLITAKATDSLTQADSTLQTRTTVTSTLCDAHELGGLLAWMYLAGAASTDVPTLGKVMSLQAQRGTDAVAPGAGPSADRAHALLMSLRGSFPSAAAYSVARHIEDWSAWLHGSTLDSTVQPWKNLKTGTPNVNPVTCATALLTQGKIWESILTGQVLCREFVSTGSYTEAADHLLVAWSATVRQLARGMRRTAMGRIVLALFGTVIVVYLGALGYALFGQSSASTGKTAIDITAVLTALGSAAGIFHVSRKQVTTVAAKAWDLAEPPLVKAESIEALAIATRRLPGDGITGTASSTSPARRKFLRRAQLATPEIAQLPPGASTNGSSNQKGSRRPRIVTMRGRSAGARSG